MFPVEKIRSQFPILQSKVNGKDLIYLDNAATTQKPQVLIDSLVHYYSQQNASTHSVHTLANSLTIEYEKSRETVQKFLNAKHSSEIIFTKGATESINLVAYSWAKENIFEGDEILISEMEHHANIIPWQLLAQAKKASLKVVTTLDDGQLDMDSFRYLLNEKTKLVAITQASNVFGSIVPIKEIADLAHQNGSKILVDGTQAIVHIPVDVVDLDIDFYVFSSHKLYGPTGVGVLYGKQNLLAEMSPYQVGGEMIEEVSFQKTVFKETPYRFEAGTQNFAGVLGLKTTLDWFTGLQREYPDIFEYEQKLLNYATEKLSKIPKLKILGNSENKVSLITFIVEGIHPFDIGSFLDLEGIAIRSGQHCTGPLHKCLGISASCRVSFSFYNTFQEIDIFVEKLIKTIQILS